MVGVKLYNSVSEWKADYLHLFRDMHKDAYGFRSNGREEWLWDDASMEETMDEFHRVYEAVVDSCKREVEEAAEWEERKRVHAENVELAKNDPNGVVYPNPDWDEYCEEDPHYAEWSRVVGRELFYFNSERVAPKMGNLF